MSKLVSVYIRPHLISFLFNELEGVKEGFYEFKKSKLIRVTKMSVLGQFIHLFKTRATEKVSSKISGYHIFLSIDINDPKNNEGTVYEKINQNNIHLELLPGDVKLLNDHLESLFRISFVEFVKGYVKHRESTKYVNDAVHEYMLLHGLYDTEIDPESLRRVYYNSKKKTKTLQRIQVPTSNQIKYFATV